MALPDAQGDPIGLGHMVRPELPVPEGLGISPGPG